MLNSNCDICKDVIDVGDEQYCKYCFEQKLAIISVLNDEVSDLEERIKELEDNISELEMENS